MNFTDDEIQLAKRLRDRGIPWVPSVGHYVLDEHSIVERGSPFQPGVYFILNHEHFMKLAGGADRFFDTMLWLPTWEDCRTVLRQLGVPDSDVVDRVMQMDAIPAGRERESLYAMMLAALDERKTRTP